MSKTKIEWTATVNPDGSVTKGETWNPLTGCTKVSEGCAHCYAEAFAGRQMGAWKGRAFTDVRCHADRLNQPLHWRKPRRVFVNSMSDLFHPAVPDDFVDRVFAVMALCPQHTYQILTKRPERMRGYLDSLSENEGRLAVIENLALSRASAIATSLINRRIAPGVKVAYTSALFDAAENLVDAWPLPQVWLGVSVEDQATADARIPLLLQTPAALRFVSCEPLLGLVDLAGLVQRLGAVQTCCGQAGCQHCDGTGMAMGAGLHWIIVGGESGPHARPCEVAWIESLLAQCEAAGTPVFIKQLGANPRWSGARAQPVEHARGKSAEPSEWPADLRVREYPT